ncbi:MAG: hypothetical protein HY656_04615 [Acidobacteria bacterium]|nr:hypothetical protein [Acidobacteriota bacterium]
MRERTTTGVFVLLLACSVGLVLLISGEGTTAAAQAAKPAEPLQVQETNQAGLVAEFTECKRKEGVLTIKVRLRNTSAQDVGVYVVSSRNYDDFYVMAAGKKYFVLQDSEKTPLAVAASGGGSVYASISKGGTWTWWAKYPAPPASVKKVNYIWPLGAPFEDIPVTDQ